MADLRRSAYFRAEERARIGRRVWRYALGLWLKRKSGTVKAVQFAIECAYSAGYHDGHEQQMRMRVQDEMERRRG